MLKTIQNLEAAKARREEDGEAGFSLIELIVVVVILGILAAVAIPVFMGLQAQAEDSARESVAANAATQSAAWLGNTDPDKEANSFTSLSNGGEYTISALGADDTVDDFCITVTSNGKFAKSGPSCVAPLTGDGDGAGTE